MNLSQELLFELVADGTIPISELTYFTTPKAREIIRQTPKTTKKDFIARSQPGDIIVAFSSKKQFALAKKAKIVGKLMATFQGIPYTTSKLVMNNNYVGGYGLRVIPNPNLNKVEKIKIEDAFKGRTEALLIRLNVTNAQKQRAISFLEQKMGLDYASSDLLKTAWLRLVRKTGILKGKDIDPKIVGLLQKPLFCSNLISIAYKTAGYQKLFNKALTWETWPRDFILDENTEKICKVDYT